MKYIKFSKSNELEGRYDSDIHQIIPEGSIEVSDEVFWQTINDTTVIWAFEPNSKKVYKKPYPKEPVEVIISNIKNEIDKIRDKLKNGGVKVGDHWFHSDSDSRIQYLGLKDLARDIPTNGGNDSSTIQILGSDVKWKTLTGDFIPLTVSLVFKIVSTISEWDASLFLISQNHKDALAKAIDPSKYFYNTGWPKGFE